MIDNPYWTEVAPFVGEDRMWGGQTVNPYSWDGVHYGLPREDGPRRDDLVSRFAWTVPDPATLAFVVEHCGPKVVDPLAGTGYWAWLLSQSGVDVYAADLCPAGAGENDYHKAAQQYYEVHLGRGHKVAAEFPDRTLLLSWPPYGKSLGAEVLDAYQGARVVYIGEGPYGCCGDDDMFDLFESGWVEVAEHQPVRWDGIRDNVTVYDRKDGAS